MRSFSSGGDGGRSSSRSFNFGGGDSSSRSFSSSSSVRSFNGGDKSSSASGGGAANSVSRMFGSGDRSNYRPAPRASVNNGNDSSKDSGGQSAMQSFRNGSPNSFKPSKDRGNVDRSQLEAFLNDRGGDRSSRFGSAKPDNNDSGVRQTIYGQQFGSNSNSKTGGDNNARNYQARRPSDEQVKNFLNMRDQGGKFNRPGGDNQSGDKKLGDSQFLNNPGQANFRNRDNSNRGDGNAPGEKLSSGAGNRFNADGKPVDRNRDGKDGRNDDQSPFHGGTKGPGSFGDGKNNVVGKDFNRDGRDRDFNRDKDFHGSDQAKTEFTNWKNVWKGKNGDGRDHRDWSGKWKNGERFDIADSIRHDWHGRHDHDNFPFRGDWWRHDHHHGWGFWNDYALYRHRPWYWWGWASCPVLTNWCGFGWSTPYYWDYGPGEYIYCNNGVVYVNGAWYEPAPVYYQQTVQLVEKVPVLAQEVAAQTEWLPLGVFAVTPDGLKEPSVMVQLAVTKDGMIGGTAFDQKAGASYNVQGTVDKNTQRAVWSYEDANKKRIIMETSVNNLTQNESTGLVHYSPNDMRVVEFVRLQEPTGQAGELPAPPQPQQPQLAAPQPVPPQLPQQ